MEIPNEIMTKIMLFNSHPVADLLRPLIKSSEGEDEEGNVYPLIDYWKFLIDYEKGRKRIIFGEDYQNLILCILTNRMDKIKCRS